MLIQVGSKGRTHFLQPEVYWLLYTLNQKSYLNNSHQTQLSPGGNDIYLSFTIPLLPPFGFARCLSRLRKWDFAPRPSILRWGPWGHRPVPRGRAGPACWNPWWAPCFCLRMWKKPGTGPRSASQNYITIIPLSVSEASWAPAQSGRTVGEGWQRAEELSQWILWDGAKAYLRFICVYLKGSFAENDVTVFIYLPKTYLFVIIKLFALTLFGI